MASKYLTLEEAAEKLKVAKEELIRMRENGEIRGFADRGNWKFKSEDVDTLVRQRQADSDPETPIYSDSPGGASDSDVRLVSDSGIFAGAALDEDSDSDIRMAGDAPDSDSDVKLVDSPAFDEEDSDSDVKMVEDDSDSDVKMVGDDSDSDVRIIAEPDSDSDITLAPSGVKKDSGSDISLAPSPDEKTDSDIRLVGSDSDVRLIAESEGKGSESDVEVVDVSADDQASDSDIALVSMDDSPMAVDLGSSDDSGSVVLSDESGIALAEDSSMMLAAESGISLEAPADSGISLDLTEEGITLAEDSGIALSPVGSGVGKRDAMSGTQFEIPSIMEEDDADFDFDAAPSEDDDTGVFALRDDDHTDEQTALVEAFEDSGEFDDAVFDVEEGDEFSDELDFDTGTVEELDVFEEEESDFEEGFTSGVSHADFAAPVSRPAPVEADWGTGPFVGLLISTGLLLMVGVVMFDLVRSMWMWNGPNPLASMLLDLFRSLYS